MSLNNIELSPTIVASLYPSQLIDTGEVIESMVGPAIIPETKAARPAENEWKSLGNNRQYTLIVVRYTGIPFLPDTELALLTNMLSACKLSLDDVAIINLHHYAGIAANTILSNFKSRRVLLFGVAPTDFGLPVSFPFFQIQAVASATYLYSPPLEEIGADKLTKSKLWVCLQRLFII